MPPHPYPNPRRATLGFGHNPLDRQSARREDAAHVAALRADPAATCIVIASDAPMLERNGERHRAHFALAEIEALGALHGEALLGVGPAGPVFGLWLHESALGDHAAPLAQAFRDTRALAIAGRDELVFPDMRTLALQGLVDASTLGQLGQAKSLFYWHRRHRFCGSCGTPTVSAAAGWRRDCPACKEQQFPRTDPVVIMLAVDGERCLLGRQARFPAGMYSCLAGFLESGETIEDAVRREIAEEAGLRVGDVSYLASQPWPFPASLMIGCIAKAATTEIEIDADELEDARWFSRDECRLMLAGEHPDRLHCPPPMAIAHYILLEWVEGHTTSL